MNHFGDKYIRSIGRARTRFQIGLLNLVYNITRYVYLAGQGHRYGGYKAHKYK
jgi:hypothetical protein